MTKLLKDGITRPDQKIFYLPQNSHPGLNGVPMVSLEYRFEPVFGFGEAFAKEFPGSTGAELYSALVHYLNEVQNPFQADNVSPIGSRSKQTSLPYSKQVDAWFRSKPDVPTIAGIAVIPAIYQFAPIHTFARRYLKAHPECSAEQFYDDLMDHLEQVTDKGDVFDTPYSGQ